MSTSPADSAAPPRHRFPSDATRSERRRARRTRSRELARQSGDPRQAALDTARQITEIAEREQDPQMRRRLFKVAYAYQMRHNDSDHERRMHLLDVMERQHAPLTCAELAAKTLLPVEVIQPF